MAAQLKRRLELAVTTNRERLLKRIGDNKCFLIRIVATLHAFHSARKLCSRRCPLGVAGLSEENRMGVDRESGVAYQMFEMLWAALEVGRPFSVLFSEKGYF